MNSIKQSQSNDEAQFLIRTFFKQIGLGKIIHQINFKQHTPISPLMMIKWLMTTIFARKSLYRAQSDANFTTRTVRNCLNDGRTNWQKLTCLLTS